MSTDRTVHATTPAWEVVRYDRAGHWYAETTRGLPRRKLTIGEAVRLATEVGSEVHLGRPGGRRFDSLVARRLAERWGHDGFYGERKDTE